MLSEIPQTELPYKAWLSLARQSAAIEEALRAKKPPGVSFFDFRFDDLKDADYYRQYAELFAPFSDACIYQFRLTQDESGWKGARSWFAHCALWPGEVNAYRAALQAPSRIRGGDLQSPKTIEVLPTRLCEVAADKHLLDRLLSRLKTFTPYDPDTLPDAPEWLWHISGFEHWNLLLQHGKVVLPPSRNNRAWAKEEPEFHGERLQVSNTEGRAGLIDYDGALRVPCRFAYLKNLRLDHGDGARAEASEHLDAQACDLIDGDGRRINPPGIKVIPDSYHFGIATVRYEGAGENGLQGYMDRDGKLLGEIRWRKARQHWNEYAAVQCADTGLWGYVDALGGVIIEPRFTSTGSFNYGFAMVKVDDSGLEGVIDTTGKMVIEARWREVNTFRRDLFIVTDGEGRRGFFDLSGNLVVDPCEVEIDPATPEEQREAEQRAELLRLLDAKRQQKWDVLRARSQDSLAPFAGAFNAHADERDLTAAGLWYAEVELREAYCSYPAGTVGRICYYYPVTADIFDMRVEVLVTGLNAANPDQALGVPWGIVRVKEMSGR